MNSRALQTQTTIHETQAYSIYRIESPEFGSVIIKASRSSQPSRREIAQLENEFRILKSLEGIEGVPHVLSLEVESHRAQLMLEDFGGLSLSQFVQERPLRLDQFFDIAKQIVEIVGELHARNIVHCDLKPANILINPQSMKVQIIDFGASRQLIGRGQFSSEGQGLTLAYIAPEQTGRVNRRVDHRTDLYSLGIGFYELLAGKLPFRGNDALEWVHAHIAKKARPLHEVDHHITPALSQIIDRMMNKAPEDRYQSTEGLLYDLGQAKLLFEDRKLWDTLTLGQRDRSTKVLLSQRIVGRERELQALNNEYMRSQLEGLRFAKVHGEAGSGKSALARDFRRVYADQIALFGFGKADPRQATFPFSTLSAVVEDLVKQITNAPDMLKGEFITKLESKLEKGLAALLVIAPSLKDLICVLEQVEDATDVMGRLHVTIAGFFATMVDVFGQVVVQIDDAHFIDEASSKACAWLFENDPSLHALLVFNFRASESEANLPLKKLLETLESHEAKGSDIALSDLKANDVAEFLKDTLHDENLQELADLLHAKSGGNPFFMGQVLKTWIDEDLLYVDPFKGWTWNKSAIESRAIAKSVLDLLGAKVQALPRNVRYLFTMASCFPNAFSSIDLTELTGVDEEGIRSATAVVVEAGLVVLESETQIRFAHEQIREAFYSLLSPDSRRELHAHVGLKLLKSMSWDEVTNDELFVTAENLNVGISQVRDPSVRTKMVDLNLRVAQLAREGSAYDLGLKFAKAGIDASDGLELKEGSDRVCQLYTLRGEFEYRTGDLAAAEATFGQIRKDSPFRSVKVRASLHLIRLLSSSGRTLDAMNEGLKSLEMFGLNVDRQPSRLKLSFGLLRAAYDLRGDQTKKIPILAGTSDEAEFLRLRQELLVTTSFAAYYIDKKILLSLCLTGYRLGMKEGLSGEITNHFLMVGMMLATRFGRYAHVERNNVNTIDRVREFIKPRSELLIRYQRNTFILPWLKSWSKTIKTFEEIRVEAIQMGETLTASSVSLYLPYYRMYLGYDIAETDETLEYRDYLLKNDKMLLDCAWPGYAFRALLRGETESDTSFSYDAFDEKDYLERVTASTTPNPKSWYDSHKMMALFMFGHYEEAAKHFAGARRYTELTPFSLTTILIRSFGVMVATENYHRGVKFSAYLKRRIRIARRAIAAAARDNRIDVEPFHFLIEAELADVNGKQLLSMDLFERAAQAALKTKSWMIAGIIYERTARFNIRYKRERLARAHAEEAAYCFERWGATAKAAQVRRVYGLATARRAISSDSSSSSSDSSRLSQQIDVESIMKSTKALNSELDLDVLSVKLTQVMMEASGASRAVLLLPNESDFLVKSTAGEDRGGYPEFVKRSAQSLEMIAIGNTGESDLTKSDSYFQNRAGMSAFAAPIAQAGSLLGLIYLENENATEIFTKAQVEVMNVLTGQAAVALQNARLYSEVSEKARMAGELKTAQAVQRTLFPPPQLKLPEVEVTGFYQPASECGGDWWFYHERGDKLFVYIGDATGHGAPAALITSAARSAVSIMSLETSLTPSIAMSRLNRAICETSKGTMNMTFFIASYDRASGTFDYCNASHEPPFWIKREVTAGLSGKDDAEAFQAFKAGIGSLDDVHGPRLGEALESEYRQSQVFLAPEDLILLFTDGVSDARNSDRKEWGQRRFLKSLQKATASSHDIDSVVQQVVSDNKAYTGTVPLDDDIMIIAIKGRLAS